jgi:serine/threonine protein kinase
MVDRVGQQLGNYRLIRLLGAGNFAEVYLGEHLYLRRQVAIKVLHTALTDKQKEDFFIEAQRLVDLSHPSIIRLIEFAIEEEFPYLIMEYAPNGTLRTRHPKGSCLSLATIVSYVKCIAASLQYVHEQKLIHRDVKPENLLVGKNQEILLGDFGIATIAHATSSLSIQGLAGTPLYMAPEQAQGKPRPASDQYALGVVVYEWLCGTAPFQGSVVEVVTQHLLAPPPPLHERIPGILPAVEEVILKALAKDPQKRFRTVTEFALALEQASQTAQAITVVSPIEQNQVPLPTSDMPAILTEPVQNLHSISREVMPDGYTEPLTLLPRHAERAQGYAPVENNIMSPPVAVISTSSASQSRKVYSSLNTRATALPKTKGLPYVIGAVLVIVLVLLGLVAELFTGSIESVLGMLHGTQRIQQTQGKTSTPVATSLGTTPNQQTSVLATDTFQRQNQALWGTASDGHQWGGDANTKPFFSIDGLKGQIAGGRGALDAVIGLPTDNVDVTISGSVNQFGNNMNFGVVLRWTDTNNYYKAFIDGNHLSILRSVNGQTSILKQMDVTTSAGVAQTLRFRSLGTMLFAKAWPSGATEPQNWMVFTDDITFSNGQFGIRVFEQPTTVITITSFSAITSYMGNNQ